VYRTYGPANLTINATDLGNLVVGESRTRTVEATGNGARFRLTYVITHNQ
jgi:hypothetical protein